MLIPDAGGCQQVWECEEVVIPYIGTCTISSLFLPGTLPVIVVIVFVMLRWMGRQYQALRVLVSCNPGQFEPLCYIRHIEQQI